MSSSNENRVLFILISSVRFVWASLHTTLLCILIPPFVLYLYITFLKRVLYQYITFSKPVLYQYITFSKPVLYQYITYSKLVLYWYTTYSKPVLYQYITFSKPVLYQYITFPKPVLYQYITFSKRVLYQYITFSKPVLYLTVIGWGWVWCRNYCVRWRHKGRRAAKSNNVIKRNNFDVGPNQNPAQNLSRTMKFWIQKNFPAHHINTINDVSMHTLIPIYIFIEAFINRSSPLL